VLLFLQVIIQVQRLYAATVLDPQFYLSLAIVGALLFVSGLYVVLLARSSLYSSFDCSATRGWDSTSYPLM
jgi:hypothetical protein